LLVVLIIAVTGIALNHTDSLGLDERKVTSPVLMDRYGMLPDGEPMVYFGGEKVMAAWGGRLLLDGESVADLTDGDTLVGAGKVGEGEYAFALSDELLVFDDGGVLLDRLDEMTLSEGKLNGLGFRGNELVLRTESGEVFGLVHWMELQKIDEEGVEWFVAVDEVDEGTRDSLEAVFRGDGVSLYRVILDLHSGRMFGTIGVILYDLAAVCLIILGITGAMLWFRRRGGMRK